MEIARMYVDAQRSFVGLCETLGDDEWAMPVACNPGWTVRDVLSHVAGVTDDVANGRLDGAATDSWTNAQVERWRDMPWQTLIAQWKGQIGAVAELLQTVREFRPPFDCHSHEHDVRHAIGRPGNRSSELIGVMAHGFGRASLGRPVSVELVDAEPLSLAGDGEPIALRGLTQFELVRSRLGRRSTAQVRAFDWSEPPTDAMLAAFFSFGPSQLDIIE